MTPRDSRESTRHHSDVHYSRTGKSAEPTRNRQHRSWRVFFPALALFALANLAGPASAPAAPALETTEGTEALRLFLDCDWGCDFTFLRSQVDYVNWVRDRQDAEVHVLVTIQSGGNSREYTFNFIGLERFESIDQRLIYTSSFTDTDDERRRGIQRLLELGLVRYVLETPQAEGLIVEFKNGESQGERHRDHFHPEPNTLVADAEDDPWNHWVYRLRLETDFRSEDRRDSQSYRASASAGRTTDMWRTGMGVFYSYRESNFEFEDGSTYKNVSRSTNYFGQVIRTLAPHWGVGVGASSRESTFLNLDSSYRAAAAIEYNYFPYSESSEREFTFAYFIGGTSLDYEEITVFDKLEETFTDQGAYIAFGMERPLGRGPHRPPVQPLHRRLRPQPDRVQHGRRVPHPARPELRCLRRDIEDPGPDLSPERRSDRRRGPGRQAPVGDGPFIPRRHPAPVHVRLDLQQRGELPAEQRERRLLADLLEPPGRPRRRASGIVGP